MYVDSGISMYNWEGPTKAKSCCIVFEVKMYQMLSKRTKYGQTNTPKCLNIFKIEEQMKKMQFVVKQISGEATPAIPKLNKNTFSIHLN